MLKLIAIWFKLPLFAFCTLAVGISAVNTSFADHNTTRLVLQITVDGLRADLLNRYRQGFGEGGFNYLLNNGANFTNAHYQYANTAVR